MNTVGVGAGSNLQFYNMVIPDMNGTLNGAIIRLAPCACTQLTLPPFIILPLKWRKLASKVGGMILMGHSQSSAFPTRAALQPASGCYPWTSASACKVKGIVQIETGCFGNLTPAEIDTLKHIPILIVDGDYFAPPRPAAPCPTEMNQITGAGGDMKFASLPDLTPGSLYPGSPGAIHGNEHMMMLDNNNQRSPKSSSIGPLHVVCN